jgi:hypothetical protein
VWDLIRATLFYLPPAALTNVHFVVQAGPLHGAPLPGLTKRVELLKVLSLDPAWVQANTLENDPCRAKFAYLKSGASGCHMHWVDRFRRREIRELYRYAFKNRDESTIPAEALRVVANAFTTIEAKKAKWTSELRLPPGSSPEDVTEARRRDIVEITAVILTRMKGFKLEAVGGLNADFFTDVAEAITGLPEEDFTDDLVEVGLAGLDLLLMHLPAAQYAATSTVSFHHVLSVDRDLLLETLEQTGFEIESEWGTHPVVWVMDGSDTGSRTCRVKYNQNHVGL